jgi:DNA-directed RNA polymerase sigma subunit (sigma70/sigma32)
LPDPDVDVVEEVLGAVAAAAARSLVRQLPLTERQVIAWRFGLLGPPLTLDEVGARLGLTRPAVWRVERRALKRLRMLAGV